MASNINTTNIDTTYPIAGQDNDSQGFRDNYTNINTNFIEAKAEIEALQVSALNTVIDHGGVGDPTTIDVSAAAYQKMTLSTESVNLVLNNFSVSSTHSAVQLEIDIPNNAYTMTLPAEVTIGLAGIQGLTGSEITFPTNQKYILEFASSDGGATISVHDLTPTGLAPGILNVEADTDPALGGDLDVNGWIITSAGGANVVITPDTTGDIVLDGQNWPQADGTINQILQTNGAGQLSWVAQSSGLLNIVEDTTPELGGDLTVGANSIITAPASNGDIAITPDGTGNIVLDGLSWPQADGTAGQYITTDAGGQLSWDTISVTALDITESGTTYGTTGAIALDMAVGTYFYPTGTTTGIITFSFTNPAASGTVTAFTLEMLGAGDNAPVWPASVDWPAATEPTWTAGGTDVVSFVTRDNGATWLGMLGGLAFA